MRKYLGAALACLSFAAGAQAAQSLNTDRAASPVFVVDASGNIISSFSGGGGGGGAIDNAVFTRGTTTGQPIFCVVETAAPTLTNGRASGLSCDTSGGLRVSGAGGGTQYAEDAVAVSGNLGTQSLGVRADTAAATAANGDYVPFLTDALGKLWTTGSFAEDAVHTSSDTGNFVLTVRTDVAAALAGTTGDYAPFAVDALNKLWVTSSYAEDSAHASGDTGMFVMAVRQDTLATLSSTTGDYEPFHLTAAGRLWTSAVIDTALPAGSNVIGALTANQSVNNSQINGVTPLMGNGVTGTGSQRVTIASDNTAFTVNLGTAGTGATSVGKAEDAVHADGDTGVMALGVRRDANTSLVGADGDYAPIQVTALGAQKVAITEGGAAAGTNTAPSTDVLTVQTARANAWSYAAAAGGLVSTTGVTAKAAGGASVKNCVTSAQVVNSHATVSSEVVLRDGAAGTVLWRVWAQAAGGGAAVQFPTPICGTANTLLEIAEVSATTTTGILVSLQGFTGN